MPFDKLLQVRARIDQEIRAAKQKANPLALDLEDDDEPQPKKGDKLAALHKEIESKRKQLPRTRTTSDGKYLLIMVKPATASSELAQGRKVLAGIQTHVKALRTPGDGLTVEYAGALCTNQAENQMMGADLKLASMIALVLAIGLITLVTRRLSAVVIVGLPLVIGVLITLAVATILLGHLNLVSGFLVAALIGLGVDFGIHLYLRYLDELALERDRSLAMRAAIMATFKPSFIAASTTAVAFSALLFADFRGFSEYGLIASIGVLLTLISTYLVLPPVALLLGRLRNRAGDQASVDPNRPGDQASVNPSLPVKVVKSRELRRMSNARQLARPLAFAMVAAGLAFATFAAFSTSDLRFFNDFKKLKGTSPAVVFDDYITREVGGSLSPALMMVDDLKSARKAERLIREHIDQNAGGPVARVLSVASFIPEDTVDRKALLADIRHGMDRVLSHGDLTPKDVSLLLQLREGTTVPAWKTQSVPPSLRHRLVAAKGGKHFILIWPRDDLRDDRRISVWATALSDIEKTLGQNGVKPLLLEENLIAARVIDLIRQDGPRVMWMAGIAILLILIIDFRRFDKVLLVGSSVVLGITSMLGVMVLFDMQLNLFNAVVLPTVLGIGIDNAVHLMHAYRERGRGSLPLVVATTGRAAMLSSATTAIGFGASIIAHHLGLKQMGLLALIGIGATFVTSTVLLPAVLRLFEGAQPETAEEAPAVEPRPAPERKAPAARLSTGQRPAVRYR
jgi:predicted RND superfamily exporter protein